VKNTYYASNIIQAVNVLEFITARHFAFSVNDLANEIECSDTTARRILRTVETVGWVRRTDEKRPPDAPQGNVGQHYRTAVRIRKLPNGS
jgi:DNA-binding IclR family transcriptional regulator